MKLLLATLAVALLSTIVHADTPANCTHKDLMGVWDFHFSKGGNCKMLDCSKAGPAVLTIPIELRGRHGAVKLTDGERGEFNLIYNQGFEVLLGYRKMFAFFQYKSLNSTAYNCTTTMTGWSHNNGGNDWSCFTAVKRNDDDKLKFEPQTTAKMSATQLEGINNLLAEVNYNSDQQLVDEINKSQKSWTATTYEQFKQLTFKQLLARAGYGNGPVVRSGNKLTVEQADEVDKQFPRSLDWRNVGGINYLSPVRNQGNCGSCYAFASMGMLEARMRIMTNNTQKPIFSPQDIVSCSRYAQGCEGGFPYLIAGKHAQEFGVVEESCYPYQGNDTATCGAQDKSCERTYVAKYHYVGGYYGGCNEHEMMRSLLRSGPMAVAIQVYEDFMHYKGGIYHHVTKRNAFFDAIGYNPFELTNHAVLLVGYGRDYETGEKFWIVKNSWGESWGESGFVRIRRGHDEIAIESLAQESIPIPKLQ